MNDIIDRVKAILWIVDATYEGYLNEVVPNLLEQAEKYCNREWRNDDGEPEDVPGPVVMFIARAAEAMIAQEGMTSESLGDYSISLSSGRIEDLKREFLRDYQKWVVA